MPGARGPAPAPPSLGGVAAGLGALYVVEGATLGGRVIARHLARSLALGPADGAAFFAGYGDRTGAMWNGLRAQAADYEARFGGVAEATAAAQATFALFEGHLRAALDAFEAAGRAEEVRA